MNTKPHYLKSTIKITLSIFFLLALGFSLQSNAQTKMSLDDLSINGELHNDNRLKFYARQKNKMKNYVKYRKNFRDFMAEEIPVGLTNFRTSKIAKNGSK